MAHANTEVVGLNGRAEFLFIAQCAACFMVREMAADRLKNHESPQFDEELTQVKEVRFHIQLESIGLLLS